MNNKQRVFVEEYLSCFNATEAARRAGYAYPNKQGPRMLVNVGIQEAIKARIDEKAMSADEVLVRLAAMARGDMGDFLDIGSMGFVVDLSKASEEGLTKLIKKVRQRTTISTSKDGAETEVHDMEIELYDAQSALVQIGKIHSLFIDRTDITSGGEKITVTLTGDDSD